MRIRAARPFIYFVERYYPDPIIFAALATLLTFLLALFLTDSNATTAIMAWGNGLSSLMTFIAQISLTLLTGHALAHIKPILRLLDRIASIPKNDSMAYAMTLFFSGIASLISWAFGLVIGGLLAYRIAVNGKERGLQIHYPLLVASGYSGFVMWHMGYSGSAQLFVATPGHVLEQSIGTIPVTETLLQPYNIMATLLLLLILPIVMVIMKPHKSKIVELKIKAVEKPEYEFHNPKDSSSITPGQKLERQRWINIFLGTALIIYLILHWLEKGFDLNLNIVNWSFLAIGLLLVSSPIEYVKLITNASKIVGQIIFQYPFYAGIMGMMMGTGLVQVFASWFIAISTPTTLAFWAFISGGILNLFVPSGGGQWTIQGPIFIEAANELGVAYTSIINGIAWGDQWTNMIQPIWTIPILAIAGLKVRDIMGYTFVTLIVSGFIFSFFLLFFAQ